MVLVMVSARSGRPALRLVRGEQAEPATSDAALIAGVVEGDREIAARFFDHVSPAVHAALFRVLGRVGEDHDDLMQSALEQVVTSLVRGSYAGDCSLRTWASLIAARVGLMAIRSRGRARVRLVESPETLALVEDPRSSVEARASARERLALVRQVLGELEETKALTLVLHDAFGHSLEEIATLTQVTVAAAQSRLVRGRKELLARVTKLEEGR